MVERLVARKMRDHCNHFIRLRRLKLKGVWLQGLRQKKGTAKKGAQGKGTPVLHECRHDVESVRRLGSLIEADDSGAPRTELDDDVEWLETLAERRARREGVRRSRGAGCQAGMGAEGRGKKRPLKAGGEEGGTGKRARTSVERTPEEAEAVEKQADAVDKQAPRRKGARAGQRARWGRNAREETMESEKGINRGRESVSRSEGAGCQAGVGAQGRGKKRPLKVGGEEGGTGKRARTSVEGTPEEAEAVDSKQAARRKGARAGRSAGEETKKSIKRGGKRKKVDDDAAEVGTVGWAGDAQRRRTWEVSPFVLNENTLELLLVPDGGEPGEGEEKLVPALHFSFHTSGQCGWVKASDWGNYPLCHFEAVGGGVGRSRVSAVCVFENVEKRDGEDWCLVLLDAKCEMNWSQLLVRTHRLVRGEGGVGSVAWRRRTFGALPDPWEETVKWAEVAIDQIRRVNGKRLVIPGFGELEGPIPLLVVFCAEIFLLVGNTYFRSEALSVVKLAKLLGVHAFTYDDYLREHPEKIAWILGAVVQLMVDLDAVGGKYDVMKADVGRMVRVKWVTSAWRQKGHCLVGKAGTGSKRNDKLKTYVHSDLLATPEWEDIQRRFGLTTLGKPLKRHGMGGKQMTVLDQAFHSGGPNGDEHLYKDQSPKKPERGQGQVGKPEKRKRRRGGGTRKKRSGDNSNPAEREMTSFEPPKPCAGAEASPGPAQAHPPSIGPHTQPRSLEQPGRPRAQAQSGGQRAQPQPQLRAPQPSDVPRAESRMQLRSRSEGPRAQSHADGAHEQSQAQVQSRSQSETKRSKGGGASVGGAAVETRGGAKKKGRSEKKGDEKSGALGWAEKRGRGRGRKGKKRGRGADAAWRQDACHGLYGIFDSPGRRGRGREIYVHLMKRMGLEHMILPGRREGKMQPRGGKKAAAGKGGSNNK